MCLNKTAHTYVHTHISLNIYRDKYYSSQHSYKQIKILISHGVSVPEKGTQTQSLCLEGSKAVKSYMSFPSSGENGKPATLYLNIYQKRIPFPVFPGNGILFKAVEYYDSMIRNKDMVFLLHFLGEKDQRGDQEICGFNTLCYII